MVVGEFKQLRADTYTFDNLLYRLEKTSLKDRMVGLAGEKKHQQCVDYINELMEIAKAQAKEMPKGHRFTGQFYVKKPYTSPQESYKVKGSAFMAEHLVSWVLDVDMEQLNVSYVREIFKDAECKQPILRQEAEPVYQEDV